MSTTHPTIVRNAIADFVLGQVDGGTLVYLDSKGDVVATLRLGTPAFQPADNARKKANAMTPDPNAAGGTIARAELRGSTGAPKVLCSVSEYQKGGNIELRKDESLTVLPGQTVSLDDMTYVAPP